MEIGQGNIAAFKKSQKAPIAGLQYQALSNIAALAERPFARSTILPHAGVYYSPVESPYKIRYAGSFP